MSTASLIATPELGTNTLTPRPYQVEALDAARRELSKGRSTCIILPTGTGKTVMFASAVRMCADKGGRTLVVAHREELITQAADTIERVGVTPGVERADSYARAVFDPLAVVASVQTISRPKRLESWGRDHFRLIVVDECHHATAETYQRVLKHFRSAKVLGVTATPDRADGDEIADVFGSVAYEMSIWDAMTAPPPGPYLCRLKVVRCETSIDLRGIRTTGGDFNAGDLEERITPLIETLANAIKDKIGDRQTIVFTPDCGSAAAMATALESLGVRADYVWGDSPDRGAKVDRYKDGGTQVLCNCMLFTEGFDAPSTSAIVLCRPTKSRALYSQMVGRGTRLSRGKEDCVLIDFAWLTDAMDLVRPADLFDRTDRADDEGEILGEMIAKAPGGVDLVEAATQAKEEAAKRQVLRVKAREREVKVRWVSYDPLAMADTLGIPMRGAMNATHDPATPGQVQTLAKFGVEKADQMSRRRAAKMLDVIIDRRKRNLATPKQVAWLLKMDVPPAEARAMSFRDASETLDRLFNKGAKKTG
jgi:superfamily II DNA or RNA helicase